MSSPVTRLLNRSILGFPEYYKTLAESNRKRLKPDHDRLLPPISMASKMKTLPQQRMLAPKSRNDT